MTWITAPLFRTVFTDGVIGETAVISLNECAELCVLDQEDLSAIAQFEHLPEVADQMLATYLINPSSANATAICKSMIDDIRNALDEGLVHHATELVMALRRYLELNPQAQPGISIH